MNRNIVITACLMLFVSVANATNKSVPSNPSNNSNANSNAVANANAHANSNANADVNVGVKNSVHNNNTVNNTVNNTMKNTNTNVNHQSQGQSQNQLAVATGGAANASVGDVTAVGGVATIAEGAVQNTVQNTNSNTAEGGTGGEAVAAAVIETGAVQNSYSYSYREVKQAPAIGQGSFAIQGCSFGGNAGSSWTGGAAFLGFGWTTKQCYDFMLAQAYQSLGEKKAACDILRNTKAGKRQEKRGVVLPSCEPDVVVIATPVPVDLSPYATKEDVSSAIRENNERLHRAWSQK